MAGQYPPPPPPPGRPPASPYGRPPYGPPGHGPPVYGPPPGRPPGWFPGRPAGPPSPYRYVPVRPPRRRSAGGTIAGIFGALTSLAVVAILGATFLVEQSGASTARPPVTSGGGRHPLGGRGESLVDAQTLDTEVHHFACSCHGYPPFVTSFSACPEGKRVRLRLSDLHPLRPAHTDPETKVPDAPGLSAAMRRRAPPPGPAVPRASYREVSAVR